jgi:alkyl hydroperoxide reductase subunit AhpC
MRVLYALTILAIILISTLVSAAHNCGMRIGRPAPDFKDANAVLPDGKIGKISLSDYKGKWVYFSTMPLAFTFVCTTEIIELSNAQKELDALNAVAIGMTVDSVYSLDAWKRTPRKEGGIGAISFPIISDLKKEISQTYNVLLEEEGITFRGSFLIDPNGVLRHMQINDLPVGRSIDEAIRTIRAFQFADKTGNVCPSKWKSEQDPSIKPDPEGKKEFFSAEYTD